MNEHSPLTETELREARDALSNAAQGVLGAYCVIALRCIDRMIPRRVHEEYDTRLFQSRYNDSWREYQCPECKCALNDYTPEDEVISDAIFYCPLCGQVLEW